MALPLVYHADYVVRLPPEHRFPMPKFGKIYDILVGDGLASLDQGAPGRLTGYAFVFADQRQLPAGAGDAQPAAAQPVRQR